MNEKLQKQIEETKDDTKIILASMVIPFLYMLLSFYIIPPLVKRVKLKKFFQYFTLSSWTFVFVFWFISGIIHSIKVH